MRKESSVPYAEQLSQHGGTRPSTAPLAPCGQDRAKPDGDRSRTTDMMFSVSLPSKTTIEQVLR